MFGRTLFDTLLGGDAVELLGIEWAPGEDEAEPDGDALVLPDYADILQAHRRNPGVAG